jgi:hypothetical protein
MKAEQTTFVNKALTLEAVAALGVSCAIPPLYHFPVSRWRNSAADVLQEIARKFAATGQLAVRSSALSEDSATGSMAGAFKSMLNIDAADSAGIAAAIAEVISSYPDDLEHLVLVQRMITEVDCSGVILTQNLDDGSPYYVINYDDISGRTDTITGGIGAHKSVLIYRRAPLDDISSARVRKMLQLAREIEALFPGTPLDIEFCIDKAGLTHLLQVRPIAAARNWEEMRVDNFQEAIEAVESSFRNLSARRPRVAGGRTILGNMPDWNPAEILGPTPRPLAASLYRDLITRSVWREARATMGYRALPDQELMVLLGGVPYIDVRNSFNSFLPATIADPMAEVIVDAWIARLDQHPELHDKVEFEIALTALDFSFDEAYRKSLSGVLSHADRELFRDALRQITLDALTPSQDGSFASAMANIRTLEEMQRRETGEAQQTPAAQIVRLLERCRRLGTLSFSILARHAFIAEALLRSALARGALSEERLQAFKLSIATVMSSFTEDIASIAQGRLTPVDFNMKYGHLRPGTYDICSLSYRDRPAMLENIPVHETPVSHKVFALNSAEIANIDHLLSEAGLQAISARGLLDYAREAIVAREYAKFVFTRDLSDSLEQIKSWGQIIGLTPDDLSYLTIEQLYQGGALPAPQQAAFLTDKARQGRDSQKMSKALKLSYLIRDVRDIRIVPVHRSAPNFVTRKNVEGNLLHLTASSSPELDLAGKIICIESADPGFDWIFLKPIKGLITKYGGSNSHMAIRAAEIGLPAAIGCGELTFSDLVRARAVELNCGDKILRAISHEV